MSEVEKLYELVGAEKAPDFNNCYPEIMKCSHCKHYKVIDECTGSCLNKVYPEFTAKKQLELIKWLSLWGCQIGSNKEKTLFEIRVALLYIISSGDDFTNCLANIIIQLWKDLTETEKEEIKRILECSM